MTKKKRGKAEQSNFKKTGCLFFLSFFFFFFLLPRGRLRLIRFLHHCLQTLRHSFEKHLLMQRDKSPKSEIAKKRPVLLFQFPTTGPFSKYCSFCNKKRETKEKQQQQQQQMFVHVLYMVVAGILGYGIALFLHRKYVSGSAVSSQTRSAKTASSPPNSAAFNNSKASTDHRAEMTLSQPAVSPQRSPSHVELVRSFASFFPFLFIFFFLDEASWNKRPNCKSSASSNRSQSRKRRCW